MRRLALVPAAVLAAVLALLTAPGAWAFDPAAMTGPERDAFRAEIRAYLLENPEVLDEAQAVLAAREAAQQAEEDRTLIGVNADALFRDGTSWEGGNPEGDVTLVEFTDYRCAYCRRAQDEVAELVRSDGSIRFVLKEFPILGPASLLSSRFAIAVKQVAGEDAYKAVHDALMALRPEPNPDVLRRLAAAQNLDVDAVFKRMDDPAVLAEIRANHALAQRLHIDGTPTFVLGDAMLRGYVPLDGMRQVVAGVRAEK